MPFEGITAIVTGGASGLGLAITEALAARGTQVAVFDIQAELLDAEVARLRKQGDAVHGYVVDVSDRAQVTAAVAQVRADLGPVLILVNNAGVVQFDRFESITDELWERVMAVNLRGPYIVTQVVLPDMRAVNWGRIVNISSSSAQGGQERMAAYVSAKAGLIGLTKALALELGRYGITVNTIPPGMVVTPQLLGEISKGNFTNSLEHFAKITPVRRAGRPEDIANAAMFLCDDASSYVTGQVIGVNGGRRT
ncbi:SDR family oxidoreductase [Frankia sp. CNm7]|uniref:SDR family oxidoreductase n=1 Tax=Frankia nepalensis TaxID=1836974 RepID=A0A937REH4_9ACTN|nr:SDR family NAD(P)-dependent oxidoreductase [Frankia nepalensis]MBL7496517.1 SDR family oxidoreductase [Frankia nepalensis]MBL7508736.1 SDR family oxidoreductase [Frankia nepalensis]MBL7523801.1 SDR family oxidoreductase [Frankia nepalensis]MBL7627490.1 SDR family oxidoreductase [Frankia nepalensis]